MLLSNQRSFYLSSPLPSLSLSHARARVRISVSLCLFLLSLSLFRLSSAIATYTPFFVLITEGGIKSDVYLRISESSFVTFEYCSKNVTTNHVRDIFPSPSTSSYRLARTCFFSS